MFKRNLFIVGPIVVLVVLVMVSCMSTEDMQAISDHSQEVEAAAVETAATLEETAVEVEAAATTASPEDSEELLEQAAELRRRADQIKEGIARIDQFQAALEESLATGDGGEALLREGVKQITPLVPVPYVGYVMAGASLITLGIRLYKTRKSLDSLAKSTVALEAAEPALTPMIVKNKAMLKAAQTAGARAAVKSAKAGKNLFPL